MSQAGIVDIEGSHPQIPTLFVCDVGSAIPIANVLEVLGSAVAAHSVPLQTVGSGNTVNIDVQYASAAASSIATNAGIASFNSADFTVDANGFVTFTGTGSAETLTGNSGGAVSPTLNNINTVGTGSITIVGNPGTSTLTTELTGLTNHNVLVGAGTATITNVAPSTAGFVLTSNGAAADPSFQDIAASGAIKTVTGNTGGAEVPDALGNFNVLGTGSITVAGSLNTETVQLTGLTDHNVLLGAGTATITNVAPSATAGIPLVSNGAAADPSFTTAVVAGGGTGATSFTAYAPICGGTTTTGVLQSADTGIATAGFVLTSNGSSALPSFQAASGGSGITTINGDTGSISGSTVTIYANNAAQNCGSSVLFSNSGTTSTLNVTDLNSNTIIGDSAGNATITATECVALGKQSLISLTSGGANTAIGTGSLLHCTIGSGNVCVGQGAGSAIIDGPNNCAIGTAALNSATSADSNIAIGPSAMPSLVSGVINIAIGVSAASAFTTSESNNIIIGNAGVIGDANTLRIGTQGVGPGLQNLCFIAGITGATPTSANTPQVVLCDNAGNLAPISSSTSGFVLTSNGSATPSFQAIPSSSFTWTDKGTSFSAAKTNGYFITAASVVATLPASPSQGDTIIFTVDANTNTFVITANTGQKIRIGSAVNSGTAGTATNGAQGDSVTIVYRSSDSTWIASSVIGTWVLS